MTTIRANVTRMFSRIEPWGCSNSQANLGPNAARITWDNAMSVAAAHRTWLRTPVGDACEGMREWARNSGGWGDDEITAWNTIECLALFVQNVASELRNYLDVDNQDLKACAAQYATDWGQESQYTTGSYWVRRGSVFVDYYTGC